MAPKREKSLLENPPAASSSEDEDVEEEEEVEDEEEEVVEEVEEAEGDEEEEEEGDEEEEDDDDDEEEEEEDEAITGKPNSSSSAVKKPKSDPNPSSGSKPQTPKTPSSEDEEEEEDDDESEEEESDSEPTPPKLKPSGPSRSSNPSGGKPIASQPKKSVAKPSTTPTSTKPSATLKRPLETENDSKRKKKKKVDDEDSNNPEESEKRSTFGPKSIFQRLWSDDDEIVVLRGMIEFKKKGVDPFSDLGGFLDSIKKSLHVEVKIDQLSNKIKRLKKKYLNNYKRGKGDDDPVFSKPHEVLSYELMKEIWGGKEGNIRENNGKDATNAVANGKKTSKTKKSNNAATKTLSLSDISMRESSAKLDGRNGSLHPCVQEMVHSGNNMVGGSFLKEGLGLIGESKSKDLEKKWRSLYAAELQLYLRRVELVREQTIAILDAHKSSDT